MNKQQIVMVDVDDLHPYEKNAKVHSQDQIAIIANSIREFGFRQPIVVDENNTVIIGHGRLDAAKYIGLKSVPVIIADDLSEDQVQALRLADNKTNESEWDDGLLQLELSEIELDMSLFGFFEDEDEDSSKKTSKSLYEEMQIKQFEHWDYVVFVFDNMQDWLNVVSKFGIEKVNAGYGKTKKVGLGRVISGKRLLEKIGNQDSDSEPWSVEVDLHE